MSLSLNDSLSLYLPIFFISCAVRIPGLLIMSCHLLRGLVISLLPYRSKSGRDVRVDGVNADLSVQFPVFKFRQAYVMLTLSAAWLHKRGGGMANVP
jgi:hypothetical protein